MDENFEAGHLQMSFTAYAHLRPLQMAEAFTHFGFPAWFRVELLWTRFIGALVMLRRYWRENWIYR